MADDNGENKADKRRAKELVEQLLRDERLRIYQTAFDFLASEAGKVGIERGIVYAIEQAEKGEPSKVTSRQLTEGHGHGLDSLEPRSLEQVIRAVVIKKTVADITTAVHKLDEETLVEQSSLDAERLFEQYKPLRAAVTICTADCSRQITTVLQTDPRSMIEDELRKYLKEKLTEEKLMELCGEGIEWFIDKSIALSAIKQLIIKRFEKVCTPETFRSLYDSSVIERAAQSFVYSLQPRLTKVVNKCVSGMYSDIFFQYTSDVQERGSKHLVEVLREVITNFSEEDVTKAAKEQLGDISALFVNKEVLTKYMQARVIQRIKEGLTTGEIVRVANDLKSGRGEEYNTTAQQLCQLIRGDKVNGLVNGGSGVTNGNERAGRITESDVEALNRPSDNGLDTAATTVSRGYEERPSDAGRVIRRGSRGSYDSTAPWRGTTPTPIPTPVPPDVDEVGVVCEPAILKDFYAGGGVTPIPASICSKSRPAIAPPDDEIEGKAGQAEVSQVFTVGKEYTSELSDGGESAALTAQGICFDEEGNEEPTLPGTQTLQELLPQTLETAEAETAEAKTALVATAAVEEGKKRGSGDTLRGYAARIAPYTPIPTPIPVPIFRIISADSPDSDQADLSSEGSGSAAVEQESLRDNLPALKKIEKPAAIADTASNTAEALYAAPVIPLNAASSDGILPTTQTSAHEKLFEPTKDDSRETECAPPQQIVESLIERPPVERVEYTGHMQVFNADGTLASAPADPRISMFANSRPDNVSVDVSVEETVQTETTVKQAPWLEPEPAEPVRRRYGRIMGTIAAGLVGFGICSVLGYGHFHEREPNTSEDSSGLIAQDQLSDREGSAGIELMVGNTNVPTSNFGGYTASDEAVESEADSAVSEAPVANASVESDASVDVDLSDAYVQTEQEQPARTELEEPTNAGEEIVAHLRRQELPQEQAGSRDLHSDITLEGALSVVPEPLSLTAEQQENLRDFQTFVQRHGHASLIEQYNLVTSEGRTTVQVGIINAFYSYLTDWNGGRTTTPEQDRIVYAAFREAGLSFSEICVVNRGEFLELSTIANAVSYLRDRGFDFSSSDILRPTVSLMTEEDNQNMTLAQQDFELGFDSDGNTVDDVDNSGSVNDSGSAFETGLDLSGLDLGYSAPDTVEGALAEIRAIQEEREWGVYDSEYSQARASVQAGHNRQYDSKDSEGVATLELLERKMGYGGTVEYMLAEINEMQRERVRGKNSEPSQTTATANMHYNSEVLERLVALEMLDERMEEQYTQNNTQEEESNEHGYCEVNEDCEVAVSQELSSDEQELFERLVPEVGQVEFEHQAKSAENSAGQDRASSPSSNSGSEERREVIVLQSYFV